MRLMEKRKNKTKINIGVAFSKSRELRDRLGLNRDSYTDYLLFNCGFVQMYFLNEVKYQWRANVALHYTFLAANSLRWHKIMLSNVIHSFVTLSVNMMGDLQTPLDGKKTSPIIRKCTIYRFKFTYCGFNIHQHAIILLRLYRGTFFLNGLYFFLMFILLFLLILMEISMMCAENGLMHPCNITQ